jgi:hypothetical protein
MNLQIYDYTNNTNGNIIQSEYICEEHNGKNISPKISWNNVNGTKSYALILEDPKAVNGTFIHWYIPYINKNISEINKLNHTFNLLKYNINKNINITGNIKLKQGKNSLGKFGYHGPCPPNKVIHEYIFFIYALDGILTINNDSISIEDHSYFENILKNNNINILNKESKIFYYQYYK